MQDGGWPTWRHVAVRRYHVLKRKQERVALGGAPEAPADKVALGHGFWGGRHASVLGSGYAPSIRLYRFG